MIKGEKERKNILSKALTREQDFLIKELADKWDEIQRGAKREELFHRAKEGGRIMVKTILTLAAIGGILTIALVAPNIFAAFGRVGSRRGFFDQKEFNRATAYLRKQKLVTIRKTEAGSLLKITDSGLERALVTSFKDLKIEPQKRWDGKWRMVVFDVPDRHKWERESFRNKLKEIGFYPMQESVFIFPYPCRNEVESLTSIFSLGSYVRFIETPGIDYDMDLKEHFGLT